MVEGPVKRIGAHPTLEIKSERLSSGPPSASSSGESTASYEPGLWIVRSKTFKIPDHMDHNSASQGISKVDQTAGRGSPQFRRGDKDDPEGSLVSLPTIVTEPVGLSDQVIYNVSSTGVKAGKPEGSAIVVAEITINNTNLKGKAGVTIDTGADTTLCTIGFLLGVLGEDAAEHIQPIQNPPRLRSATGHYLTILGQVELDLLIGTYKLRTWVVVQEGDVMIFLLGSDVFYDRLTFDKGKRLIFNDPAHEPVPVFYTIGSKQLINQELRNLAPISKALLSVHVTDDESKFGRTVLIRPAEGPMAVPVVSTVAKISKNGDILVMAVNNSNYAMSINVGGIIGYVNYISDEQLTIPEGDTKVFHVETLPEQLEWPESALTEEFVARLPSNVQINEAKLKSGFNIPYSLELGATGKHDNVLNVYYIHDREERKCFLDGTGEDLPTPPSAEPWDLDDEKDPEEWLNSIDHSHLRDDQWHQLRNLIDRNREAFSKNKIEIGCCTYFKAELPLKPDAGYLYSKPRPLSKFHKEQATTTISDLLEAGVIRPSRSPHATNIVVVKKKALNGVIQHRVCVDLRQVNQNSVPNRFPNLQIDEAMAKLQGAAYRSALDFANAFHQIVLTDESTAVTAFHFDGKLFEYRRLPFGHVNAMNIFCCVMALLCEKYEASTYYADDLVIVTRRDRELTMDEMFEQHLKDIEGMLFRVIKAGLKLKAHKCNWAHDHTKPLKWVGKTLEGNLLRPQDEKIEVMVNYPSPTTAKQALSWAAMVSYYRCFLPNLAAIIKPVNDVIRLANDGKKESFVWTPAAQKSFEEVKQMLCSDLVLRMPVQGRPFILHTDASHTAIGVVLSQIDDEKQEHPCAYASRKFNDTELKHSSALKELLAIIYGLQAYAFYLQGNLVYIYSDCRAWTFLTLQTGVSGKISRYAMMVSTFNIIISYIPGKQNKVADALSRAYDLGEACDNQRSNNHPALEKLGAPMMEEGYGMKREDYMEYCSKYLEIEWPKIMADYESKQSRVKEDIRAYLVSIDDETPEEGSIFTSSIEELSFMQQWKSKLQGDIWIKNPSLDSDSLDSNRSKLAEDLSEDSDDCISLLTTDNADQFVNMAFIGNECFSREGFQEAQTGDMGLLEIITSIKRKEMKFVDKGYLLRKNILMRKFTTKDGQEFETLCIPKQLVNLLLQSTHGSLLGGHHGSTRYLLDMSRKYYWKGMTVDINRFQKECYACQVNDKYPVRFKSGQVVRPAFPMHIVHFDIVTGLPKAFDGSYAMILFYDGFSRYTFAIALASEKADYIVRKIMAQFIAAFGFPHALHSDNGRNVDGNLMRHLAAMLGIVKTTTPPHTPNANPCETACGAVAMLMRKALVGNDKKYWPVCLPFILHALNNTVHTSHGYTPSSLFFARAEEKSLVPLVPFEAESANASEYIQKVRRFQEVAYQIASARNERHIQQKKDSFDKVARTHHFKEGGFVMLKNMNPADGPGRMKLRPKYLGPYRIIKAYPSSLALIPWVENELFEEYMATPGIFKQIIKAEIKQFSVRIASVKHCKPYKGSIEQPVKIIDPHLINDFLDSLDVNCSEELLSVLEEDEQKEPLEAEPALEDSASYEHSYAFDPAGEPDLVDDIQELLDDFEFEISEKKLLLEKLLAETDEYLPAETGVRKRNRVIELLRAAKSASSRVREGASIELSKLIKELKAVKTSGYKPPASVRKGPDRIPSVSSKESATPVRRVAPPPVAPAPAAVPVAPAPAAAPVAPAPAAAPVVPAAAAIPAAAPAAPVPPVAPVTPAAARARGTTPGKATASKAAAKPGAAAHGGAGNLSDPDDMPPLEPPTSDEEGEPTAVATPRSEWTYDDQGTPVPVAQSTPNATVVAEPRKRGRPPAQQKAAPKDVNIDDPATRTKQWVHDTSGGSGSLGPRVRKPPDRFDPALIDAMAKQAAAQARANKSAKPPLTARNQQLEDDLDEEEKQADVQPSVATPTPSARHSIGKGSSGRRAPPPQHYVTGSPKVDVTIDPALGPGADKQAEVVFL